MPCAQIPSILQYNAENEVIHFYYFYFYSMIKRERFVKISGTVYNISV